MKLLSILWTITICSTAICQGNLGINDSTYAYWSSQIEQNDAVLVDSALLLIVQNQHSLALPYLARVIANTPHDYTHRIVQDSVEVIKCWDAGEFIHYSTTRKKEDDVSQILWLANAYPRAYFYLGFIYNHFGEYEFARTYLRKGQELEPTQPRFWKEIGFSYSQEKNYQKALECYGHVDAMNAYTPPEVVAAVLRAKGFCYIELDQLFEAKRWYTKSLLYAPGNALAKNQLEYIQQLENGGEKRPSRMTTTTSNTLTCFVCKQPSEEVTIIELIGIPFRICKECVQRLKTNDTQPE